MKLSLIHDRRIIIGDFNYRSDKLIVLVHGLTGDRFENGRFNLLEEKLLAENFSTFKFDFPGSGESKDNKIIVEREVNDLRHVLNFFGSYNLGLVGLSLGGYCSILAYEGNMSSMVLWAPVTSPRLLSSIKRDIALKSEDYEMEVQNHAGRKFFLLKYEKLVEFAQPNVEKILDGIKVPVLVLHGENDNVVPVGYSLRLNNCDVEVLKNQTHEFEDINSVVEKTLDWFKQTL